MVPPHSGDLGVLGSWTALWSQKVPWDAPEPSKPKFRHKIYTCVGRKIMFVKQIHYSSGRQRSENAEKKWRAFCLPRGPFEWPSRVARPAGKNDVDTQTEITARTQERHNRKSRLPNACSNGAVVLTLCVLNIYIYIYICMYTPVLASTGKPWKELETES